jgi:hypothetical protein
MLKNSMPLGRPDEPETATRIIAKDASRLAGSAALFNRFPRAISHSRETGAREAGEVGA